MSNNDGTSTDATRMSGTDSYSRPPPSHGIAECQPLERGEVKNKSNPLESSPSQNEKGSVKLARDNAERRIYPSAANSAPTEEDGLGEDLYPGDGTIENPFVVDWDRQDPENPYNWSKRSRWLLTCQVCNEILIFSDIK